MTLGYKPEPGVDEVNPPLHLNDIGVQPESIYEHLLQVG